MDADDCRSVYGDLFLCAVLQDKEHDLWNKAARFGAFREVKHPEMNSRSENAETTLLRRERKRAGFFIFKDFHCAVS